MFALNNMRRILESRSISWWTLVALMAVCILIGGLGGRFLLRNVEHTYIDLQVQANERQAKRIAGLLEQELEAGVTPVEVHARLQQSLVDSPHDEANFLCLLGGDSVVLCHPAPAMVGMNMKEVSIDALNEGGSMSIRDRMAGRIPGAGRLRSPEDSSNVQLVFQQPVRGADWMVSVHSDVGLIRERVDRVRASILKAGIPILIGIVLLGTLGVRLAGRYYERQIEAANDELERRVHERTVEAVDTMMRYRSLFEAAPSAIFVRRADGAIVDFNRHADELTGFPRQELLTKSFQDVCRSLHVPPSVNHGNDPILSPHLPLEGTLVTQSGKTRDIQVYENSVPQKGGTLILDVVQDVTELRSCELQFRQSQKLEVIGMLAGGIAHDFNNLLTAVLGFSELAQASLPQDSPGQKHLQQVFQAGQKAARLTQQLLAFSRKQILKPRVLHLNQTLNEIEKMLRRIIGEDIQVITDYETDLWPILVDPAQLEQVVFNLATNARDAMPNGGTLRITTRNLPTNSLPKGSSLPVMEDHVLLSVQDTGCGIPKELQEKIFEPFFTTKELGKGTGLGLATVHGIIKQHGGEIWVESQVNGGTTFHIAFRRADTNNISSGTSELPAIPRGTEAILVVEDDQTLLFLADRILRDAGYRVLTASHGEEAIKTAGSSSEKIDLMITDVVMSGMSGPELAERFRTLRPDMKVLFMTGYTDDTVFRKGIASDEYRILNKPFTPKSLGKKVREVLDKSPAVV